MPSDISNYIGKKYGHLTVIGLTKSDNLSPYYNHFDFKCDCGNIISDEPQRVISGHRTSCGKCNFRGKTSKPTFDLGSYIGKKYEKLTVIGLAEREPEDKKWYLLCKCDCGNTTKVTPYQFKKHKIKSCGCLRKSGTRTIDNRTNHPLYGTWSRMLSRCENPSSNRYDRYGGRGISVCKEWHDFWSFVKWSDSIGGRPEKCTLDRIDNNGNYEPSNCRWATHFQQSNNKSSNISLSYNGETKTLKEWSIATGIAWSVLHHRYSRGWSAERILSEPVNKKRSHPVKST